jgi:multidrug efflux pump
MSNWIHFFVTKPIATISLYLFLFISGLSAMLTLPMESEPEIARNEIYVSVNYSSSLDAVLNSVAIPIEKKFLSIAGVDLLKSDVTNNNIQFVITFAQDSDMNSNMIKLQSAISDAKSEIPENAIITIPPIKENNTKVMSITFSSELKTIEEINGYISRFKSLFETSEGVSAAVIGGDDNKDICSILLKPAEMNARNLSFHDVTENIKSFYIQGGSSDITIGNSNIALEIGYDDDQSILKHPISSSSNSSVYLHEIAEINKNNDHKNASYRLDGNKVVTMVIYKKQSANLISVCTKVREKYNQIKQICKQNNIDVNIVQDKSIFVNNGITSIYATILESILLVSIIIFMFLRSIVLSLIPIIAIPLSIVPTFFLMKIFGVAINVYSLFGIVVAIGLVVDDAIVVIENIYRYLNSGSSITEAAIKGTTEILLSIISMTITLAIVYLPILFTSDPYIKAFFDFAFVISTSVICSGLISITISPMLFNMMYYESKNNNSHTNLHKGFLYQIERLYLKLLCFLISNRNVVLYLFTTLAISVIIILLRLIQYEEEIGVDRGFITYQYNYKTDNNLDINYVDQKLLDFQDCVKSLPIYVDIEHIITSVSQNDSSVNYIDISLKEHKYRKYSIKQITDQIQQEIAKSPSDISIYNLQGGRNDLVVRVNTQFYDGSTYSDIIGLMYNFAPVKNIIQDFYTVDVRSNNCYILLINKDICKLYGVMPHTISDALTSIKKGKYFRESASNEINKISFGIYNNSNEQQLQKILDIPIKGYARENNQNIPRIYTLKTFATVKTKKQISKYHRISGNPGMTFTMIMKSGYSMKDMQNAVKIFNKHYGTIAYSEINIAETRKLNSMNTIIKFTILSILFIYLLLSALFESFVLPLIILSIVPASGAGGLLFLYIFGMKINTVSIIGIITLIGLITKHGIMLIDYTTRNFDSELHPDLLILDACLNRFRPILMTTACMILGAIPLIIKTNVELIEYKMPIALVIIGGTFIGTVVTLLILPVYYVTVQEIIYKRSPVSPQRYIVIIERKLLDHYKKH